MAPSEEQIGSKTGQLDESVLMEWGEVPGIGRALLRRLKELKPTDPLWPFEQTVLNAEFRNDVNCSGVHVLGPHFYSLRHGGASDDLLTGRRKRDEVKARGRWLSDVSVRRYGKAARTMKEAARLGPVAAEYGNLVQSKLSRFLDGAEPFPAPPVSLRLAVGSAKPGPRRITGKRRL